MSRLFQLIAGALVVAFFMLSPSSTHTAAAQANAQPPALDLHALASLEPIDTHTHVAKGDPSFYALLDRLHMHILDILLVDDHDDYRKALAPQLRDALEVVHQGHGHAALCTSIDPFQFNQTDFTASAIRGIDRDFADGAVAVKIWKNIGMEVKDRNGRYILPDDPALDPIYKDIESHNRTLVAHVAEPDEAWLPPDSKALDASYYQEHPIWYMYRQPEAPKKQQLLDARDRLLAAHPKLRVVGAHLGSLEDDLPGLAQRLDRYPNFAVDTAARVPHLVVQPSAKVREFLLKYQDRIVYGTDLEFLKDEAPADAVKEWNEQYARDWRYFSTTHTFEYEGHQTQGLGLPQPVLRKLYHDNAVRWIPGIVGK